MTPRSGEELAELEARQEPRLVKSLEMVAPGSAVREGIDNIVHARTGGLIVIGEPEDLSFMFSGGIKLDMDYTPAFLYQVAKMDGAIVLNANATVTVCHSKTRDLPGVCRRADLLVAAIGRAGMINRAAGLLAETHQRIRTLITLAHAVSCDETPLKVGPKQPPVGKKKAERSRSFPTAFVYGLTGPALGVPGRPRLTRGNRHFYGTNPVAKAVTTWRRPATDAPFCPFEGRSHL
ncbi:hypothetical protein B4Q13_15980 [Lacticaseibacillus rhamnosus]